MGLLILSPKLNRDARLVTGCARHTHSKHTCEHARASLEVTLLSKEAGLGMGYGQLLFAESLSLSIGRNKK